jgi:general secretion pathway protein C
MLLTIRPRGPYAVLVAALVSVSTYCVQRALAFELRAAPVRQSMPALDVPVSPPQAVTAQPTPKSNDPLVAPSCPDVLVTIVTEGRDVDDSAATLRRADESSGALYRVGNAIGERAVAFVGTNPRAGRPSVWLSGVGPLCQAELFGAGPVAGAALTAGSRVDPAARPPRRAGSRLLVVPERVNGRVAGIRLLNVAPGSVLALLGVENGDRIESVNGRKLTTPEEALLAYSALQSERRVVVRLNRRGSPVELTYHLR